MSYLLDTCVLSTLRKIKNYPNRNLETWFGKHAESAYYISVLSIGEIQKGIAKLTAQGNKSMFENWLIGEVIPRFENRILAIDAQTASIWGELCGKGQKKGVLFPVVDSLLAATAIQHNLILVTENIKDFAHTGAHLFNPF